MLRLWNVSIFLPRKGTEKCSADLFQFFYPARGRKHLNSQLNQHNKFQFFYPARGRKRIKLAQQFKVPCCFNFFTPQGDGNSLVGSSITLTVSFQFFYPARGRKRISTRKVERYINVSIFLPRKGTETIGKPLTTENLPCFNFFTPQGDGNSRNSPFVVSLVLGFNFFTPQGDGNRRRNRKWALAKCFKFFTPQGDGNYQQRT